MGVPVEAWKYSCAESVLGVAVDSNGNVFTADTSGVLTKISPDGQKVWEYVDDNIIQCVAVDNDGNIYFGDYGDYGGPPNKVVKLSPDGQVIWTYACKTEKWGSNVYAIKIDSQKYVYVGDSFGNVSKLTPSGALVWEYHCESYVRGVTLDASGNVYAVDENYILTKLDTNGNLVWEFNWNDSFTCVDIDQSGNLYAGDYSNGVSKVNPSGELVWTFKTSWSVFGVSVDKFGNIYAGDWSHIVYKLSQDGTSVWQYTNESPINAITTDSKGGIYIAGDSGIMTKIVDPDIVVEEEKPQYTPYPEPLPEPEVMPPPKVRKKKVTVFKSTETNFEHNGLSILHECKSCTITKEINGAFQLDLKHPIDKRGKYKFLQSFNIIQADGQLFRIPYIENIQSNEFEINASCQHIFYDLGFDFNIDTRATNKSVSDALKIAIAVNPKFVVGECDDLGQNTAYFVRESPVKSIFEKILSRWGGELDRNNYVLGVKERLGKETGYLISYAKNIKGFKQKIDHSELCTRMHPVGKDGLELDEVFLNSPRINDYPVVITREYSFDADNKVDLKNQAKQLWGVIDIPKVNYEIDFEELKDTVEYESIKKLLTLDLGDTVIIRHRIFGVDIRARVIKTVKDVLLDRYTKVYLGDFLTDINDTVNNVSSRLAVTEEKVNNVETTTEVNNEAMTTHMNNTTVHVTSAEKSKWNSTAANESGYTAHLIDTTIHVTANDKTKWNAAETNSKTYTDNAIANLVNNSPDTLNTLNELAQALNDDPNFSTTILNLIATKADKTQLESLKLRSYMGV